MARAHARTHTSTLHSHLARVDMAADDDRQMLLALSHGDCCVLCWEGRERGREKGGCARRAVVCVCLCAAPSRRPWRCLSALEQVLWVVLERLPAPAGRLAAAARRANRPICFLRRAVGRLVSRPKLLPLSPWPAKLERRRDGESRDTSVCHASRFAPQCNTDDAAHLAG